MTTYYWNTYQHRADAQTFGEAVEHLVVDGTVTPERVVNYAAPAESPIHEHFEWDDIAAGQAWRKQQARQYLGAVRVKLDEGTSLERLVIHVKTEELGDVYATKERLLSDAEMQAAALQQAMSLLRSARERYRDIEALARVWEAVDQMEMTAS